MNVVGDWLAGLPLPVGPIVTGLLPFGLLIGVGVAAWANRRGRRALAIGATVFALVCGTCMVAFLAAITA
jgi:predicted membrane-bound mannosyltransferase